MPQDGQIGARLASGELGLTFVWAGDRFVHEVRSAAGSLKSAEPTGLETPVYQEVHQQGDLVFASGMAGDRHWSASVEPIAGSFAFDVACRAKSDATNLGVAYEGGALRLEAATPAEQTPDGWRVAFEAPAGEPPHTARLAYRVTAGYGNEKTS